LKAVPVFGSSMPRVRTIPAVLAVLYAGFAFLPCHLSAAEPPPWLEIHSAHFTVITDAGDKKGREVAFRFEQMRAVFAGLLTKDHINQPLPLTILAFDNDKSYYQLTPLYKGQPIDVPGFFLHGEDQNFIALNLSEPESWRAVAGDLALMMLSDNYPAAQPWFDQGLTEYFSSIRPDSKQIAIGGDPELVGISSRLTGNQPGAPKPYTEILNAQPWISIPDLFGMKFASSDPAKADQVPAESWIVIHYLLHDKRLPDTGTYFDLVLNQHVPVEDAIQKAYGVSSAQLEQAVKEYFHSLTALQTELQMAQQKNSSANLPQPYQFPSLVAQDDSAIISKPLPESDAQAIYAGVQVRIPERRDLGLQQLKKLATTATPTDIKAQAKAEAREKRNQDEDTIPSSAIGNAIAHRMLAWDEIQHDNFDDALVELGDAAALNQKDMWVRYYLSILKYRMAQARHTDIAGLPNMMLDLKAALEWYPELANAYDLLAVARNEGGTTAPAMQAERAAMMLSPRNEVYVYHLAQIYIAGKKWEAAKALLERLKTSADPKVAQLAAERLDEIGNERKYGLTATAAAPPQLAPQKSPFDVLEEDAAKRAAEAKSEQARGADTRTTKFVKGRLVAVDCSEPPAAVLTVATQGVVLKLRAVDYKSLLLIGADGFSCTWRDRQVTANYKPGGLSDGDLVSLEMR
jgi:hypothetical protein